MLEYKYVCHRTAFSYLPLRCVLWLSENFGTISRFALRKSKKKNVKTKERRRLSISSGIQHEAGMTGSHPATKARVK